MEDKIIMSKKELNRTKYIALALEKKLTQKAASKYMGLSYKQTKRIIKKVRKHGIQSIAHGNRGKESPRKFQNEFKQKVVGLYAANYPDFGPTFANEKLLELHDITLSTESLRQILIDYGHWTIKKRKHSDLHVWRERKHYVGEMIQIDGSHHRWLEDRLDQEFCLMGFIDDATGNVYGKFYEYEGIMPIYDSFIGYMKKYGIPDSVYLDRHSTYKTTRNSSVDEQLKQEYPLTQFEKIMKHINVRVHHARSPQAKGRVERLFETLQDRLVKEMRLANICSINEANKFIESYWPKFNEKFSVKALSAHSMHIMPSSDFDYKWIFSISDNRVISKDYTIRWMNRLFLIKQPSLSLKGQKVLIKQTLDGDLRFETKTKILSVQEVTQKEVKLIEAERKRIKKILATTTATHEKSKKSWMDGFYIGNPKDSFQRRSDHVLVN